MTPRLLGIDHGSRRIGVAATDPLGSSAQPVEVVDGRDASRAIARLGELARERDCPGVVLGLPRNMDGSEGPQAAAARRFGTALAEATGLAVIYWDERLTTQQAAGILREQGIHPHDRRYRERVDVIAAQLLLAAYLDSLRHAANRAGNDEPEGESAPEATPGAIPPASAFE